MRYLSIALLLLVISPRVYSQKRNDDLIYFRNGAIKYSANIDSFSLQRFFRDRKIIAGKSFVILQFEQIPSKTQKQLLRNEGIDLLEYIPQKAYIAQLTRPLALNFLKLAGVRAVADLKPEQKIAPDLLSSANFSSTKDLMVLFFKTISFDSATAVLKREGYSVIQERANSNTVIVRLQRDDLLKVASLPAVKFISVQPPAIKELDDDDSRDNEHANILQTGLPEGYNLSGDGVTIGVYELNGLPQMHVDFVDRLIVQASAFGNQYHSTHVHGIVGSAGLINELYTGYAPKSRIISSDPSSIDLNARPNSRDYQMVLTNNSWGFGTDCNDTAAYWTGSYIIDEWALDFPSLQNVFSAGNSGTHTCLLSVPGYHTVLAGHQSAKSTITVGNTNADGSLFNSSSKGPTSDGRLKPEIVATGTNVISTVPTNTYGSDGGTSMSSPAVVGGLALLYQQYRRLHNGNDPKSGLMKNIICNSSTDLGNPGPDFAYGFGRMNLLRAAQMIDSNHYITGTSTNQSTSTHTIVVPPNTAQLKVMLYWQDPPGSLIANRSLVNDLDLQVTTPDGSSVLPFILDTLPANLTKPATRGEDHINNIEQVVIDHPAAGTYSFVVKGTEIPVIDEQEYYISYDVVPNEIKLGFPAAQAKILPNENAVIQWDSWGNDASDFTIQFSADNGTSWSDIATHVSPALRQYAWTVPDTATEKAMMQIIRNADGAKNISGPFIIEGAPAIALSADQCPGYINISWPAVKGATDYEVMMINHGAIKIIDTISTTSYHFKNLSEDSTYWVTVRARMHGIPGRRAVAISRQPNNGNCNDPVSDGDLKADTLVAPLYGRKFTSLQLGTHETIQCRIKNLDNVLISGFTVSYAVNGGTWYSETVSVAVPANGTLIYPFINTFDFSAPGNYNIVLAVNYAGDNNHANDTVHYLIRHLDNAPLNLLSAFTDDFEKMSDTSYLRSKTGISGADRFDFINKSKNGQLQVSTNIYSDKKANAVMLQYVDLNAVPADTGYESMVATYNLSAYDTALNDVGLNFTYTKNSSNIMLRDSLYIRGSDIDPWLPVMSLDTSLYEQFTDRKIKIHGLANYLKKATQNFSSSFQVRWSKFPSYVTYSFDNVKIYDQSNDVEMQSIDSLSALNFGLSDNSPIHITVRNNTSNAISDLSVHFRIDSGTIINETITNIPADTSQGYVFTNTANLAPGSFHTIETWVEHPSDSYRGNDTATLVMRSQPLIQNFPYLENFETGDGSWYPQGVNSSWAYGTPSSTLINGAASGQKAWKTNLAGGYNDSERSYLYSPFFDLGKLKHPAISFSLAMNMDSCGYPPICDILYLQYSYDGINWLSLQPDSPYHFRSGFASLTYNRWHVSSNLLPDSGRVQFRFQFRSDDFKNYEGVGIDDIHIYENNFQIYDSTQSSTVIEKTISGGNDWVDFVENGKVIASIQPAGQDLGSTSVQSFVHTGAVRNFHGQYYLNRNYIVHPSNPVNDSVTIRFYFPDSESDSVIFANNCNECTKPSNAYRFGISKYSTTMKAEENDSISDDMNGDWSFIDNAHIKIVPFQHGYYAEIKTKSFSEFWLNNGGTTGESYLPVEMNLTAEKKSAAAADLSWTTASEINIDHFDVEVAKGDSAFRENDFKSIHQEKSKGPSSNAQNYKYSDAESNITCYYRIKAVDVNGNFSYSKVASVIFSNEKPFTINPNPSSGIFNFTYQVDVGKLLQLEVYNVMGQRIQTRQLSGNGSLQTTVLDLSGAQYPYGVYFVHVLYDTNKRVYKLLKTE